MENRMTRKRERLFTLDELAALTGIPSERIAALESTFLTDEQRAYLLAVGYRIGFYPHRRPRRSKTRANTGI